MRLYKVCRRTKSRILFSGNVIESIYKQPSLEVFGKYVSNITRNWYIWYCMFYDLNKTVILKNKKNMVKWLLVNNKYQEMFLKTYNLSSYLPKGRKAITCSLIMPCVHLFRFKDLFQYFFIGHRDQMRNIAGIYWNRLDILGFDPITFK